MPIALEYDALIEEAERRLGIAPNPPEHFSEGLRVLLHEAKRQGLLTREGRRLLQHEVLRVILQRSMLEAAIAEVDDAVRGEVLVITGLPRTCSTLLHNMLADLGTFAWLPLWQALEPSAGRVDGSDPDSTEASIQRAGTQIRFMNALSPDLLRVHPMKADRPEECATLMQLTGMSDRFSISLSVPEYREWAMDPGVVETAYRDYARLLNVVFGGRRPILLKAPSHAPHMSVFADRIPEASVLWLQRDIDDVEASFGRLVAASRQVFQSETTSDDWLGHWRDLEPPDGSRVLDHGDALAFVEYAAALLGIASPNPTAHADWLRPSPAQ